MVVIRFKPPRDYGADSEECKEIARLRAAVEGGADITAGGPAHADITRLREQLAGGSTNRHVKEAIRRLDEALDSAPSLAETSRYLAKAGMALARAGKPLEVTEMQRDE